MDVAPDGTAYDLHGKAADPCIVLIHGLGLSRRLWDPYLDRFAGFRVLAYDLYGHGESQPSREQLSLRVFAKQIAGLLDHLAIAKAHIVGFSIGGMINRRFAMDFPHRAQSLAILNSPHNRGDEAQAAVEDRAARVREAGAEATLPEALKRWFTPAYLADGAGPELVRNWRLQADGESYAQAAWVLANGVRELIAPEPAITLPSLVMTCENDVGSNPQMSRDIAAEIAGSDLIIVPQLQHLGLMEDVDVFVRPLMEFLNRH